MRGQSSIEFFVIISLLLGFIVMVLVPAMRETDLNVAVATTRVTLLDYTSIHPDYYFTSVNYSVDGRLVSLQPSFYFRGTGQWSPLPPDLKQNILAGLRKSFAAQVSDPCCANSSNFDYCFYPC